MGEGEGGRSKEGGNKSYSQFSRQTDGHTFISSVVANDSM